MVGEKRSLWSDLPLEIASMILSYLPHKDHFSFRATCKLWRSVTAFHGQHQSPFLLLLCENQYHLFDPICNCYDTKIPIQQPPITKILHSNFGWLLTGALSDSDPSIFFFNIFTKERIDLPDLPPLDIAATNFSFSSSPPLDITATNFSFSSSPASSSDCFVVGLRIMLDFITDIVLTKPGEKYWTILDDDDFSRRESFFMSDCNPIFHNGECFCLDVCGTVAIFDPKDPPGTFRICGKQFSRKPKRRQRWKAFIIESDDDEELLSATVSEEGQIYIYKLHPSGMDWINITNLEDKILYLSGVRSWIETTKFKGMGNKIYFPKFKGDGMVFYSLDTKNYHYCDDKFWSKDIYGFSESMYYSTWIKPMF